MTHAYSWKCNSEMLREKYQLDITGPLAILPNSRVANDCQVANNYTVSPDWS